VRIALACVVAIAAWVENGAMPTVAVAIWLVGWKLAEELEMIRKALKGKETGK
jgi:hypothetical protein